MKFKKGDIFYKESNNRLVKLEIKDVVYILDGGTINNKKYPTDKDIDRALNNGQLFLSNEFYKQKKIEEKRLQIEQLQKELAEMEK